MREGGGENLHRWVTWWNRRCLTQHPAHRQQQQPLFLKWASFDSWDQQTIGNDGAFALLPSMASDGWRRVVVSCGSRQTCPTRYQLAAPPSFVACIIHAAQKNYFYIKGQAYPGPSGQSTYLIASIQQQIAHHGGRRPPQEPGHGRRRPPPPDKCFHAQSHRNTLFVVGEHSRWQHITNQCQTDASKYAQLLRQHHHRLEIIIIIIITRQYSGFLLLKLDNDCPLPNLFELRVYHQRRGAG
jgi:hypothetical protein